MSDECKHKRVESVGLADRCLDCGLWIETERAKKPYAPPTLTELGTVGELTRGAGGSLVDGSLGNTKDPAG